MKTETRQDPFLTKRIAKYDDWLEKGQISYSSKVIPVSKSLGPKQWVLPAVQALDVLEKADSLALQPCECRTHYQRCDNPLDVCFLLNEVAEKYVAKGKARHVSLEEAKDALALANESGLVHLALYMPDHQVFALCNCCSCCCHDLQILKHFERRDLVVRSEYIAATDAELCMNCGECVDRCVFGARTIKDGQLDFDAGACLGCGLCVTVCPVEAVSMENRTYIAAISDGSPA